MAGLREGHLLRLRFVHRSAAGAVLWESGWLPNALMNEGEKNILDAYLRGQNVPTAFFLRLFADTPQETDSLASLTNEPGGLLGYAPIQIERSAVGWPTLDNSGGDFQAQSKTVTFRATGSWPSVTHAVLATSSDNSGLLIDSTALSQSRTLRSGQALDISLQPSLA